MASSLQVVQQAMEGIPGLRITSTYRSPEKNRAVGGSSTSWHMNKANPAVDVAGPQSSMQALYRKLKSLGYDAELLFNSPGHYDHVHFAIRSNRDATPTNGGDSDYSPEEAEGYQPEFDGYQSPQTSRVRQFMSDLEPLVGAGIFSGTDYSGSDGLSNSRQRQRTLIEVGTDSAFGTSYMARTALAAENQEAGNELPVRNLSAADRLRSRPQVGGV